MKSQKIDPKNLISPYRLDLMVRYLLFRDWANGTENEKHLSLYARLFLTRNGGYDGFGEFDPGKKVGIADFIASAKATFNSIKENGFDKNNPVPIGEDGYILDGMHRTAAAIALNEDIWVQKFPRQNKDFTCKWFYEHGFTTEDMMRIFRAYADLKPNIGFFCLFATTQDKWDYIQSVVAENFNVVGWLDLDYTNNFMAFENLIKEIYCLERDTYSPNGSVIDRKISILKMQNLAVRILLVEDTQNGGTDIFAKCKQMKLHMREVLHYDVKIETFLTMHSAVNEQEARHLKRLLLSPNNDRVRRQIIKSYYREAFLQRLRDLKKYLAENNIDLEDVCIVHSAALEVLGIRNSGDLDIAILSKHGEKYNREKYTNEQLKFPEKVGIVRTNYACDNNGNILISHDNLISDYEKYFIFFGFKFENLEVTNLRKTYRQREKDKSDCRLIQQFNDFALFFEGKQELQQVIREELARRAAIHAARKAENYELLTMLENMTKPT
ncbi:MAG: hypothetical protein FWG64_00545 [Firmicutes bacterium]|nr:hypothetical protein [Bacillota bacterium]